MNEPREWRELESRQLLECRIFTVERSTAESPRDGSRHDFYRIQSVDWAQIVPVTAAGEIVMVRQYRHGSRRITLEIPGGLVEPGEQPGESAARECLEETGYRASAVRELGVLNPNPALFGNRLFSFVAENAEPVAEVRNEATEHTGVVLVPASEVPAMLMRGDIDHALVVATLWRWVHESL